MSKLLVENIVAVFEVTGRENSLRLGGADTHCSKGGTRPHTRSRGQPRHQAALTELSLNRPPWLSSRWTCHFPLNRLYLPSSFWKWHSPSSHLGSKCCYQFGLRCTLAESYQIYLYDLTDIVPSPSDSWALPSSGPHHLHPQHTLSSSFVPVTSLAPSSVGCAPFQANSWSCLDQKCPAASYHCGEVHLKNSMILKNSHTENQSLEEKATLLGLPFGAKLFVLISYKSPSRTPFLRHTALVLWPSCTLAFLVFAVTQAFPPTQASHPAFHPPRFCPPVNSRLWPLTERLAWLSLLKATPTPCPPPSRTALWFICLKEPITFYQFTTWYTVFIYASCLFC